MAQIEREGERKEEQEEGKREGDGESMAGVDPLNDLIRAPGHSPAKLHTLSQTSTHTHTHYKALPASNNTLSVLATGAMEEPLIPL